jgi:hypothetical protein
MKRLLLISSLLLLLGACHNNSEQTTSTTTPTVDYNTVQIPDFNADSAFRFVEQQLDFGNRYPSKPEIKGHKDCATFIHRTMQRWCDTVITQHFTATLWNGEKVDGHNIIASLAPQREQRILLAAHWDSRRWADHDLDTNNWRKPLPGANDGASGVAVLMEMARIMAAMPPDVGVDFIFFDCEDQGIPEWANRYEDNTWCLGSQYWARSPHRMFYTANYGILFDMVGTFQPRYTKEEVSMGFAAGLMNKMWDAATAIGYGNIFVNELTSAILDDHLYINQILHIPTIDVVQNSHNYSFYPHWHTLNDNLDAVDKETLRIVANVTLKTIYADFPPKH